MVIPNVNIWIWDIPSHDLTIFVIWKLSCIYMISRQIFVLGIKLGNLSTSQDILGISYHMSGLP